MKRKGGGTEVGFFHRLCFFYMFYVCDRRYRYCLYGLFHRRYAFHT